MGKTTLAAATALALAESGRNVGLLSIDPAKRLQSALGLDHLGEAGELLSLPGFPGSVRAAVLHVEDTFLRWAQEQPGGEARQQLISHPFFRALSGKLATAADTFAAARMAEWIAQYPETDVLVLDTAPGLHAMDFLAKPERVLAFLDGKLVEWLRWFFTSGDTQPQGFFARMAKGGARRILDGLAQVGGATFLRHFGEFLVLADGLFASVTGRLGVAIPWLRSKQAVFVLVAAVREDSARVALRLRERLAALGLAPEVLLLNRTLDARRCAEEGAPPSPELARYVRSYLALQERMVQTLGDRVPVRVQLPLCEGLQSNTAQGTPLADLLSLGRWAGSPDLRW